MEIIETERLWVFLSLAAFGGAPFQEPDAGRGPTGVAGAFNDRLVRWPLLEAGARGLRVELSLICETTVFLCLSADTEPLALGGYSDVLGGVGVFAMFLKVTWHSISSPAKTVGLVH